MWKVSVCEVGRGRGGEGESGVIYGTNCWWPMLNVE